MLRLILLLLIVAGVAGYFTRPDEATMRAAADAVLQESTEAAAGNLDLGTVAESAAVALAGDRAYTNYYVAAKYDVTLDGTPVVTCYGAFTQAQCSRVEDTRTGG
ncbi:MAG: hypothetical protein K2P70_09885 [Hyphomonadaceae bacterium]|jgi:hypothetical protein|nr:hypothetical protein [Hyphomonadaceae bacterium]